MTKSAELTPRDREEIDELTERARKVDRRTVIKVGTAALVAAPVLASTVVPRQALGNVGSVTRKKAPQTLQTVGAVGGGGRRKARRRRDDSAPTFAQRMAARTKPGMRRVAQLQQRQTRNFLQRWLQRLSS